MNIQSLHLLYDKLRRKYYNHHENNALFFTQPHSINDENNKLHL